MKSPSDYYQLNNDVQIPCLGFGTWQTPDGDAAIQSVKAALACGYRHIDTAAAYGNETGVGIAVKESGVPRGELFITSKLRNSMHGYNNTMAAFARTLADLDTDYLDMYLIHWPNPLAFRAHWQAANAETWQAFEELYRAGKIRAIGVSNFRPHHIEELLKTAEIAPAVNQILLCPGETAPETVTYCRSHDILLEAYSPLGTGGIFKSALARELARKYHRSVAQLSLRWSLQMGFLPLPKSVTAARIAENIDIFGFELTPEDLQIMAELEGCCTNPPLDPDLTDF